MAKARARPGLKARANGKHGRRRPTPINRKDGSMRGYIHVDASVSAGETANRQMRVPIDFRQKSAQILHKKVALRGHF
jgi:hypothetical protein